MEKILHQKMVYTHPNSHTNTFQNNGFLSCFHFIVFYTFFVIRWKDTLSDTGTGEGQVSFTDKEVSESAWTKFRLFMKMNVEALLPLSGFLVEFKWYTQATNDQLSWPEIWSAAYGFDHLVIILSWYQAHCSSVLIYQDHTFAGPEV